MWSVLSVMRTRMISNTERVGRAWWYAAGLAALLIGVDSLLCIVRGEGLFSVTRTTERRYRRIERTVRDIGLACESLRLEHEEGGVPPPIQIVRQLPSLSVVQTVTSAAIQTCILRNRQGPERYLYAWGGRMDEAVAAGVGVVIACNLPLRPSLAQISIPSLLAWLSPRKWWVVCTPRGTSSFTSSHPPVPGCLMVGDSLVYPAETRPILEHYYPRAARRVEFSSAKLVAPVDRGEDLGTIHWGTPAP